MARLPYQGIATFLKTTPIGRAQTRFGFLGLPYDCSVSFRPGARLGPNAIRQASLMLTDGAHPHYGVDPAGYIVDLGDAAIDSVAPVAALAAIEDAVTDVLGQNLIPLLAGGDHLTTLGTVRALAKRHGPVALLHFDAHGDLWPGAWGEMYGHGTWLYHAIQENLVDPTATVQIGIRSPVEPAVRYAMTQAGGAVFSAEQAMYGDPPLLMSAIAARVADKPLYITFDIDALDPAFAPGTGTPEIGGLTTMWALMVLRRVLDRLDVLNRAIGMDVVEVCPPYDVAQTTALAAATLLWTFASSFRFGSSP